MENAEIRKIIRARRRTIFGEKREELAEKITKQALLNEVLLRAQNVGIFLSFPEEVKTDFLRQKLSALGKNLYLPFVKNKNEALLWLKDENIYQPDNAGILAPKFAEKALFRAEDLDCVITPLVAFDENGYRLGMGGGFYDRTFGHLNTYLLGIAYEIQRESFKIRSWDRRLNALATEQNLYLFDNKRKNNEYR